MKDVCKVGFSAFFNQLGIAFSVSVFNKVFLDCGGEIALAAYGVLQRCNSLIIMPILGLSQGMIPIVGYNWGARNFPRVRQAFFLSIFFASIHCCLGAALLFFFPDKLVGLFSKDPQLLAIGAAGGRILSMGLIFAGFQLLASGFYQGVGRALPSLSFSVLRQFVLITPLVWALARLYGLQGAWWAFPIANATSFLIMLLFFLYDHGKNIKNN
ncbi:MAG: hypothetical protein GX256_07980 [Fretibacterium sp.]|nr:hypothetical protein [Fretibacterium sp.]